MDDPSDVTLSPTDAAAFLEALEDDSEGGYRERLLADPKVALAEFQIAISDLVAETLTELPTVEHVHAIRTGSETDALVPVELGTCTGFGITLLAASTIDRASAT